MLSRFAKTSLVKRFALRTAAISRNAGGKIIYTNCDEAPALATYSLLPIVKKFAKIADIEMGIADISLSARILAHFPEYLKPEQRVRDELAELGDLCKSPEANIIKLPNISASVPQLNAAIAELQGKGYALPNYVQDPRTDEERAIKEKYAKVLGSSVNPVLREGNSDRRVAPPVKKYAMKNPHKMLPWAKDAKTNVQYMKKGDFYETEQSITMPVATTVNIEHISASGEKKMMKKAIHLQLGEVFDSSVMRVADLRSFYEDAMTAAKSEGTLFSLHLKATMMKVSDPVMFGHCVQVFFKDAFAKHGETFKSLGVNTNNGLNDLLTKVATLPEAQRTEIMADLDACYANRPAMAMVDSSKGITNLHTPSDVIVDASMPCVVRDAGSMWNKEDKLQECKCTIPDRCYAKFYEEVINFTKKNGQFDVTTMGNVSNVGLMAQKAEEYGSHPNTFIMEQAGKMRVTNAATGATIFEHDVAEGDIWRACQAKDAPIKDWVRLAVSRARATGDPAIFWLDPERAHDRQMIEKVNLYLQDHDITGLDITIADPVTAVRQTMERAVAGKNTISVTGNVLRDYLTDLFPIIELGTSAKMLSIVPLLAGGGLFETGAGGSAPKHVDQFLKEGHLRWDSLGEYLALAVSLEHLGTTTGNDRAIKLGVALNEAIGKLLDNRKSPSRKVKEIDNRGSNFYIALYWARAMAKADPAYQELADKLTENRSKIIAEHQDCQGSPQDVGGYYKLDVEKAFKAMRPSATLNSIIDA